MCVFRHTLIMCNRISDIFSMDFIHSNYLPTQKPKEKNVDLYFLGVESFITL